MKTMKVARISTMSFFIATQLKGQLLYLKDKGLNLTIISGKDKGMDVVESFGVEYVQNNIPRKISPVRDLWSLIKLFFVFKKNNFDLIHSVTPKAGLLSAVAGFFAGTPVRVHTFTGIRWINMKGLRRSLLKNLDRLLLLLNTQVYSDSFFQRELLFKEGLISKPEVVKVLGKGSLSGIDLNRFNKKSELINKKRIYELLQINENAFIFLFIGRITEEKGVLELVRSFKRMKPTTKDLKLILVGPMEADKETEAVLRKEAKIDSNIIIKDYSSTPEEYYSIADVFCLPSYREGFGTSILEAAAMHVPSIGSNIEGLKESIIDGETGLLVEAGNVEELYQCMERILYDEDLRFSLANEAYNRVKKYFDAEELNRMLLEDYRNLLQSI